MKDKIYTIFSFISEGMWDLSPNSSVTFIIYLLLISAISIFFIIYVAKKFKKVEKEKNSYKDKEITLNDLLDIANNKKSSVSDLLTALMLFNEHFTVDQDKKKSFLFFEKTLTHKRKHKKIFDYFHKNILPKNIQFKKELNEIENKALKINKEKI